MHESDLEPPVPSPEPACGGICDKLMKNLLLTLTILGKVLFVWVYKVLKLVLRRKTEYDCLSLR